jgi:tetratricopeptide (TPR) repeat protein
VAVAVGSEADYKALWELAWAGCKPWCEILPVAQGRCAAAQALGDLRAEAEERSDLSFLLERMGRAQEGIAAQRQALKLFRQIGDPLEVARTLGGLGDALKEVGRFHSAVRCWRVATDWFFRTGDPLATFQGLVRIAKLLKLAGRSQEAGDTFRLALSIAPDEHCGWTQERILGEVIDFPQ